MSGSVAATSIAPRLELASDRGAAKLRDRAIEVHVEPGNTSERPYSLHCRIEPIRELAERWTLVQPRTQLLKDLLGLLCSDPAIRAHDAAFKNVLGSLIEDAFYMGAPALESVLTFLA